MDTETERAYQQQQGVDQHRAFEIAAKERAEAVQKAEKDRQEQKDLELRKWCVEKAIAAGVVNGKLQHNEFYNFIQNMGPPQYVAAYNLQNSNSMASGMLGPSLEMGDQIPRYNFGDPS